MRPALAAVFLVASASPLWAQDYELTLSWGNDVFARRDRHFTNGLDLGLSWTLDTGSPLIGAGSQIRVPV